MERYVPLLGMAVIIFSAQALGRRAQRVRLHGEAVRLRGAMAISLQALRRLYENNLRVLAGGRPPLVSGRNQITVLRILLPRLLSLDQPEIGAVIEAVIATEAAETALAVAGTRIGGVAFGVPKDAADARELESVLSQACAALETAEGLMDPACKMPGQPAARVVAGVDPHAPEDEHHQGRNWQSNPAAAPISAADHR